MTTTTNTGAGSNSAPLEQALKQQFYEFGQREGDGLKARSDFCDYCCARAHDGDLQVDAAAESWADYQRGVSDSLVGSGEKVGEDAAQRASDLKHYITLGANKMLVGPEMLANARMILARMRDDGTAKGARAWDTMLVWARKQNKTPERALSDAEIEDLFRAQAKKGSDELDRLTSVQTTLKKQVVIYENERIAMDEQRARVEAGDGDYDDEIEIDDDGNIVRSAGIAGVYTALELIDERIVELGGTRKEQRKAQRARIREAKKAAEAALQAADAA